MSSPDEDPFIPLIVIAAILWKPILFIALVGVVVTLVLP